MARECAGSHDSFRSCWTRFDSWTGYSTTCLASVMDARRSSEPLDGVRLPGEVLTNNMSLECAGYARDSAKVEDQVRFLARTLLAFFRSASRMEVSHVRTQLRRTAIFFETMSKRRKGFPSETQVKRGVRIVNGDKLLEEKLGRNDLCPCGSGRRFKKCCLKSGRF